MATPFPGLQHRDGGGGVAVMAGSVNAIDPSPSMACVKNNPALKPPILIFLFFHKAIRSELEGLHSAAMAFATGAGDIKPLLERYHFLRAIYEHHCNAEDEVGVCVSDYCFRFGTLSQYNSPQSLFICFCWFFPVAQFRIFDANIIRFDFHLWLSPCVLIR